nr:hypothetical protein [uncultured Mediterranean phage uvMED]
MAQYKRPNLDPEQAEIICLALEQHIKGLEISSPAFEVAYKAFLKVRDCKLISTDKA